MKFNAVQIAIANENGEPYAQHVIENAEQAAALQDMLTEGICHPEDPEAPSAVVGVLLLESMHDALGHFRRKEEIKL